MAPTMRLKTMTRLASVRRWALAFGALALGVGVGVGGWLWATAGSPDRRDDSPAATLPGLAPPRLLFDLSAAVSLVPGASPALPGAAAGPLASAQNQAAVQQFQQLKTLPPGDAAIALAQQIEAGIEPGNAMAYMDALFNGQGAEVERAAIKALARAGDASVMQAVAAAYGLLPVERRGRILQVLETAGNPAAISGLQAIVAEDVGERRSPLVASAMVGMAHIGTADAIEQLMAQASGPNDAYALNALQRLNTRQGVELLRTAAAGDKGYEALPPNLRATFGRVAAVAEAALPD